MIEDVTGIAAPFIEQLRGNKALAGALAAITAAVVGVILAAIVAIFRFKAGMIQTQ